MPVHQDWVGVNTNPITHNIDARWLMAYAAGLDDLNPAYMDTSAGPVRAHPVFPVCLEWPVSLSQPVDPTYTPPAEGEFARAVHAAHDLHLFRAIRADDQLSTQSTVIGVRHSGAGAVVITRLDTVDALSGEPVARTYQTGIYRGVALSGDSQAIETVPAWPDRLALEHAEVADMAVAAGAAHRYTECAKIWNPIHTDRQIALEAGLPDIILHGTATLAMCISRLVNRYADAAPERVTRLGCRFTGMVLMPSVLQLESKCIGDQVAFQVCNERGDSVISDGFVVLSA